MSLIREKWQPACLAGNLKSIRYKRALTSALVKFSLKKSYFHFVLVLNSVKPQIISWFRSPLRNVSKFPKVILRVFIACILRF